MTVYDLKTESVALCHGCSHLDVLLCGTVEVTVLVRGYADIKAVGLVSL
jgi:hypothetical protein